MRSLVEMVLTSRQEEQMDRFDLMAELFIDERCRPRCGQKIQLDLFPMQPLAKVIGIRRTNLRAARGLGTISGEGIGQLAVR